MISQHIFSNTFSQAAIQTLKDWADINLITQVPTGNNIYLEDATVPIYNSNDESHCVIPDDGAFEADTFNGVTDPNWRHFYIRPDSYNTRPVITASGAEGLRKTISPFDTVNTHPASLLDSERVKLALRFEDADYWTVTRVASNQRVYHDWLEEGIISIYRGSSYNIIDSVYFGEGYQAMQIYRDCHYNTVQKCFFDGWVDAMHGTDLSHIQLMDNVIGSINDTTPDEDKTVTQTLHTKIILNEFRNGKVMRLQCRPYDAGFKDFSGTIVDSNTYWQGSEDYCNSSGIRDVNGHYSLYETGFGGVKAGSKDINNPVLYTNNVMMDVKSQWEGVTPSSFVTVYFESFYVYMLNNIIVNSPNGPQISANGLPQIYHENRYCRIEDNILYECGYSPIRTNASLLFISASDGTCKNNVVKNPQGDNWAIVACQRTETDNFFGENTVINKGTTDILREYAECSINADMPGLDPADTNVYKSTAEGNTSLPYDYTISYYKYSSTTPQTRVIPNVLSVEQNTVNQYLRTLAIPLYNPEDTSHVLITEGNGNISLINTTSKQHFYIEAGTYGLVNITEDGDANNKRTLSMYDPLKPTDLTHPGKLDEAELVDITLDMEASNWDMRRLSRIGTGVAGGNGINCCYLLWKGASNNTLDSFLIKNSAGGWFVGKDSHNNTIQKHRYDTMRLNSRVNDVMATMIKDLPYRDLTTAPNHGYFEVLNTHFILGEIKNANDGMHISRQMINGVDTDRQYGNVAGTVVDSCDYYVTPEIYTDGNGNLDPTGNFSTSENAIDFKIGSDDPLNPVIVTNNHFWGFRKADGVYISDGGAAIGILYNVKNYKIENNVIFDSAKGIGNGQFSQFTYSSEDVSINNNLIYDVGPYTYYDPTNASNSAITFGGCLRLNVENNVFINIRGYIVMLFTSTDTNIINNNIINMDLDMYTVGGTSGLVTSPNNYYPDEADGGYTEDYSFTTDKYTNSPQEITLTNAIKPV